MELTMTRERPAQKTSGAKKKEELTTLKSFPRFAKVIGELAKLRDTNIPIELDEFTSLAEEKLLAELARRQRAIEEGRQD